VSDYRATLDRLPRYLAALAEGPLTLRQLAKKMGCQVQTARWYARRLRAQGLAHVGAWVFGGSKTVAQWHAGAGEDVPQPPASRGRLRKSRAKVKPSPLPRLEITSPLDGLWLGWEQQQRSRP